MNETVTASERRPEDQLTRTERRLFDVLRGQPDRVFNRAELVFLVMPGTVVLERTIDVHVKGLRKKLGLDAARIQTIRGIGYCWVSQPSVCS